VFFGQEIISLSPPPPTSAPHLCSAQSSHPDPCAAACAPPVPATLAGRVVSPHLPPPVSQQPAEKADEQPGDNGKSKSIKIKPILMFSFSFLEHYKVSFSVSSFWLRKRPKSPKALAKSTWQGQRNFGGLLA
jgi:hypothetical protein